MTGPLLLASLFILPAAEPAVSVGKAEYEGRPHLVVEAGGGTAWLDVRSGGLSRFIDGGGRDWIAFRMKPWGDYPDAAAGAFRGFPNLVHGEDPDAGFGHPGHDTAASRVVERSDNRVVVACETESGRWATRWTFTPEAIELAVERTPDEAKYWVLYEGPIGGDFDPGYEIVRTPSGSIATPGTDFQDGDRVTGVFPWAEFFDAEHKAGLRIERLQPAGEGVVDCWAQLGSTDAGVNAADGMMVFGFGRGPEGIDPRLTGPRRFRLRFVPPGV